MEIIISLIAASFSLVALILSWIVYKDRHQHKRLSETLKVVSNWDTEMITNARAKITQLKDFHQFVVPKAIPLKLILEQREKDFENGELITITDHINTLLNFMNIVAIGIERGVYEEELLKTTFRQTFSRHFYALDEYINELSAPQVRNSHPWPELDDILSRWKKESDKREVKRAPGTI